MVFIVEAAHGTGDADAALAPLWDGSLADGHGEGGDDGDGDGAAPRTTERTTIANVMGRRFASASGPIFYLVVNENNDDGERERGTKGRRIAGRETAVIAVEFRAPLFVLIVVVPLLAVASFFVQDRVDATIGHERLMRAAQIARGVVLRTQIEEETGVRGYATTGDPEFLQPFVVARSRADARFDKLLASLAEVRLGTGTRALVENERSLNAEWLSGSAEPLIADPRRTPRALALERRGKKLVDQFRSIDQQLQAILDTAAEEANESSSRAISWILILNALALTVLTIAALIFGYLQSRAARAAFEARLLYENEKRIADALQEAFLQKALPLTPGVGLHATYVPASREAQVGGDWYDALELPSGRILFSIGDVAGHGLDAAVVMNRARQSIVSTGLDENDPALVLARANRSLVLQNSRMVTAICGYLDPVTREIAYATAGHPPPVMATAGGSCAYLPHEGLPLGIIVDAGYTTFRVRAEPGAMLVLYTDGVLEHKRDVIVGQARLLEAVRGAVGTSDPALEIQRVVFAESEPTDDVAILAISFGALDGEAGSASLNALQLNRWQPKIDAGV